MSAQYSHLEMLMLSKCMTSHDYTVQCIIVRLKACNTGLAYHGMLREFVAKLR